MVCTRPLRSFVQLFRTLLALCWKEHSRASKQTPTQCAHKCVNITPREQTSWIFLHVHRWSISCRHGGYVESGSRCVFKTKLSVHCALCTPWPALHIPVRSATEHRTSLVLAHEHKQRDERIEKSTLQPTVTAGTSLHGHFEVLLQTDACHPALEALVPVQADLLPPCK